MPYLANTWLFVLSIEGNDIIPLGHLNSATVIEDAGSVLPTFECSFSLEDPDDLRYLNEGNKLKLTIGRNYKECVKGNYVLHRVSQGYGNTGEIQVYLNGIYDAIEFLQNARTQVYAQMNSSEVMKKVGKKYFKVNSSYYSNDKMNWVQTGVSDKKFFNDVWSHSYTRNNTPVVGITASGEMRIKPLRSLFEVIKARFGTGYYYYDPNYVIEQNTRWNNSNGGYGKFRILDNIDTGFGTISLSELLNVFEAGRNQQLPRAKEARPKLGRTKFINENIHIHYWDAQISNVSNLLALNNVTLTFTYKNFWHDIHVLDIIFFSDFTNAKANSAVSGRYLVTKVSRNVLNNQLVTLVQCVRQGLNDYALVGIGGFIASIITGEAGAAVLGLMGQIAESVVNQGSVILSDLVSRGMSSVFNGTFLSELSSIFPVSLSLGEYSQALESIAMMVQSGFSEIADFMSGFPALSALSEKISEYLLIDCGEFLSNILQLNFSGLIDNVSDIISDFVSEAIDTIASEVMGSIGVDISGILGSMGLSYRSAADDMIRNAVHNLMDSVIDFVQG